MATLTHPKGRKVTVPDAVADSYLANGWSVAGQEPKEKPPVVIPDGDPVAEWKVDELKAYAERESIDLNGATKKDDILAVLTD